MVKGRDMRNLGIIECLPSDCQLSPIDGDKCGLRFIQCPKRPICQHPLFNSSFLNIKLKSHQPTFMYIEQDSLYQDATLR